MLASVTRLSPRQGSLKAALGDYRAARLQSCLSQLHGLASASANVLRARTFLRLGDPKTALSICHSFDPDLTRDRAEAALLRAVAHARLRNEEKADDALREAFVYSVSSNDRALEAEVEFYKGLTAFGEGDLVRSREACTASLVVASTSQAFGLSEGLVPLDHVVARTEELLGLIDAAEGSYRDWIGHARETLAILDRCPIPDTFQEAFALKNLSILARDFDIEQDARLLAERVRSFAWTSDICRVAFTTLEALGWCLALRGDTLGALRLFRRAETAASTDPERILVSVDRALFAREFGHQAMVTEEVEHALELADAFNWETAAGDYRGALLTLAQVAAPTAPARARQTLDRYTSIRNSMDTTFAARIEPRARAEEAYTHGLVLRAEGKIRASTERLQAAFETWNGIGFEWRAGRAALELAELDAGDVFRLAVRRELFRRPDSVFSTRARLVA